MKGDKMRNPKNSALQVQRGDGQIFSHLRHSYCKIRFLEEARLGHRQAASKYLQELERIGLLRG